MNPASGWVRWYGKSEPACVLLSYETKKLPGSINMKHLFFLSLIFSSVLLSHAQAQYKNEVSLGYFSAGERGNNGNGFGSNFQNDCNASLSVS